MNEQSYWLQNPLPKMSTTYNCNHCINYVASVERFAASREKNNELQSHNLARRCVRLLRMKIMAGYVANRSSHIANETSFVNQYVPVREIASDTQDVGWNSLITSGS